MIDKIIELATIIVESEDLYDFELVLNPISNIFEIKFYMTEQLYYDGYEANNILDILDWLLEGITK